MEIEAGKGTWISILYKNQDNREIGHTCSVPDFQSFKKVMKERLINPEDIMKFKFNWVEFPIEKVRERLK